MSRLTLLGRPLPASFRLRVTTVLPGGVRAYDAAEWAGALVVVERGAIDLDARDGSSWRFETGAVLWLEGMPLEALHNRGDAPVLLASVSRVQGRRRA